MKSQKPSKEFIQSVEELISEHSREELSAALVNLQTGLGWKVLRAVMMKEYMRHVADSLDKSCKTGTQIEAAYATGIAQSHFDMANSLIPAYRDILQGVSKVVEVARPE